MQRTATVRPEGIRALPYEAMYCPFSRTALIARWMLWDITARDGIPNTMRLQCVASWDREIHIFYVAHQSGGAGEMVTEM